MSRRTALIYSTAVCLLLGYGSVQAYTFTPTDAEWASWPGYCKAKYVWTQIGRRSKYANLATPAQKAELADWEKAGIRGIHHYCTGSIWLNRAMLEDDKDARYRMLKSAQDETQFSFAGSDRHSPRFIYLAIQLATIMHEKGESENALRVLQDAIADQPNSDVLYSASAVMLRKLGRLNDAKQILLRGTEATEGRSAEIYYNLGLVSLEMGDIGEASRYADKAYAMGYPLPGLRTRLEKQARD